MVEVPGPIAHVDLRVAEIGDDEPRPARTHGDAFGSLPEQRMSPTAPASETTLGSKRLSA